jgi:hypothetical protein
MPTMAKVAIDARVIWRSFKSPTSPRIVAVCDELNLSLEADSEQELRTLIPEAMHLLMLDLFEDNEINAYLRERGWRAHNLPSMPDGDINFNVPFELVAGEKQGGFALRGH